MQRSHTARTLLFEHTAGGLAEHAAPVAAEWVRRGHRTIIMATGEAMPGVRATHQNLGPPERVEFRLFGQDPIDWPSVDAIFNVIISGRGPARPDWIHGGRGPAFGDLHGRFDIPRVVMNHGLTDKRATFPAHSIGNSVGYANVLFASGPAMFKGSWEAYSQKWPEIEHSLKIIPVGCPKTDVLFKNIYSRDEILRSYGLDPSRPTVLYAPTYHTTASLEQAGEAIVSGLGSLPVNLLVCLHHISVQRGWAERLRALSAQRKHVRVFEADSNRLFVAADLLVGDASGASFEFIVQDKPVVFFDVPEFFALHGTGGVGYWGRSAGVVVSGVPELGTAVRQELDRPERKAAERSKLISQLVYTRGNASENAVQALLDLIGGRIPYPLWGPRNNVRQDILLHHYLLERIERCALETRKVALFGAGAFTSCFLNYMAQARQEGRRMPRISAILDDGDFSVDHLQGIPLCKPSALPPNSVDVIILSTDYHQAAMRKRCREVFGESMPVMDLFEPFPWHQPDAVLPD